MSLVEDGVAHVKKQYESVPKNKIRLDVTSDGRVEASLNTERRGWMFTAYVTSLLVGSTKSKSAGVRVEKNL